MPIVCEGPLRVNSGRSRISIKSDPDRFDAVITRSRSSDAEGGKAWRCHRGFDGSGHERHRDGSSRISTATKSCQRIIRSLPDRTFRSSQRRRRHPRVHPWQIGRRIADGGHRHRPIYEIEAGDSWRRSAHRRSLFASITSPCLLWDGKHQHPELVLRRSIPRLHPPL